MRILRALIAFWMIGGGIAHLLSPHTFVPIVPRVLPAGPVIAISGLVELAIGAAVLWPRSSAVAGLAFALLCAAYLPLHLWDFFRPDPVFRPPALAAARVGVQLLLIGAGVSVWRSGPAALARDG